MKKLLTLVLLSLSLNSYAQSKDEILKEINGVSAYHATLLGYAYFCKLPEEQTNLFKSQFVGIINNMGLSNDDYITVNKTFLSTLEIANKKGPSNSNMTCESFAKEFTQIYNSIKPK